MRPMLLAVILVASGACVDVPDSVRAQFAPPTPAERTNYRPGRHGTAPPIADPPSPAPKAAATAVTAAAIDTSVATGLDAGAFVAPPTGSAPSTSGSGVAAPATDGGAL